MALGHRILVLNRLWQAVNIVGVKRGFALLFQGNAQVIHTGDGSYRVMGVEDWIEYSMENQTEDGRDSIQTVRLPIRIPKVLLLRRYDRMPIREVKLNKQTIFERDKYRCQYCGDHFPEAQLNIDHVIPRDHGGKTTWENVVTSCIYCNSQKANRMPHQAGMNILRRPFRPKWRPFAAVANHECEDDWKPFIHSKGEASE